MELDNIQLVVLAFILYMTFMQIKKYFPTIGISGGPVSSAFNQIGNALDDPLNVEGFKKWGKKLKKPKFKAPKKLPKVVKKAVPKKIAVPKKLTVKSFGNAAGKNAKIMAKTSGGKAVIGGGKFLSKTSAGKAVIGGAKIGGKFIGKTACPKQKPCPITCPEQKPCPITCPEQKPCPACPKQQPCPACPKQQPCPECSNKIIYVDEKGNQHDFEPEDVIETESDSDSSTKSDSESSNKSDSESEDQQSSWWSVPNFNSDSSDNDVELTADKERTIIRKNRTPWELLMFILICLLGAGYYYTQIMK
jgi:hypothetical protein